MSCINIIHHLLTVFHTKGTKIALPHGTRWTYVCRGQQRSAFGNWPWVGQLKKEGRACPSCPAPSRLCWLYGRKGQPLRQDGGRGDTVGLGLRAGFQAGQLEVGKSLGQFTFSCDLSLNDVSLFQLLHLSRGIPFP